MPVRRIVRPVVRSFVPRFRANAASWVRAGGHAIVWVTSRQARLVVERPQQATSPTPAFGPLSTSGGRSSSRWLEVRSAGSPPFGSRMTATPSATSGSADRLRQGPTTLGLDCLSCAACCKANRVVLDDADIARFDGAGCGHLARPPYARRDDGATVLVLRL